MSSSQRHRRSRRLRTLCAACQERKARFRYRGRGPSRSRPHAVFPVLPCRDQPGPVVPSQRTGVTARPALIVFGAGSRVQPAAGRPRDRAPTAHARPSAACVFCRVVTGPPTPQFTLFGAPDRVVRLAAARVRLCKIRNHQPSPQASPRPRGVGCSARGGAPRAKHLPLRHRQERTCEVKCARMRLLDDSETRTRRRH
jgi:hypothetical protein